MRTTTRWRGGAALLALSLALTACGSGSEEAEKEAGPESSASAEATATATALAGVDKMKLEIDDDAEGPAPEVEGAKEGGTVRVLALTDYAHMDPARIYVNYEANLAALITRQLTTYRQDGDEVSLVGDLATNTGETDDGGKTWTYHLRDGITYEDGSPIKAEDIKYGIERTFVPEYSEGPTYLQQWLTGKGDFRKVYKGPYGGKHLDAISTPDDKTIVFKLKRAQPDMPFAVSMSVAAPVKKSKDTKAKYDQRPFATGPYKIVEHKIDKSLKLVRNDEWDPETDPARHQYPDAFEFEFGVSEITMTDRIIAAKGDDAAAVQGDALIPAERVEKIQGDGDLMDRTTHGLTPFVYRVDINHSRITSFEVRKALYTAMPRRQMRQIEGGPIAGEVATTVLSPTVPGFEPFDLFGVPAEGDPEAAKKILEDADAVGTKIVYAFADDDRNQKLAVAVDDALSEAGFDVVLKEVSLKNYFDEIGELDNKFDLYIAGWGADWPSGATVIPPLLDGTLIAEQATNYSHFDDDDINEGIADVLAEPDLEKAAKGWADLDRAAMEKIPFVPYLYIKAFQIHGPAIGGAQLDAVMGTLRFDGLYVEED